MDASLVSLAGPPGSGKTTVAHWLSGTLEAELILEDYAGNPFLAESYAGRDELRLAGQVWFLLSRVNQLARSHWPAGRRAVSDYAFLQDEVYARIWLDGDRLQTYRRLAENVAGFVQPPMALIHLDGPVELLKERIGGRGRGYEAYFTDEFLQRLREDYVRSLQKVDVPVIHVDVGRRDLCQPAQRQWVLDALAEVE
ncbi:unnamed protein product [marine sediment metagenome]|uniref:Deoxynucleoside kinase domain-containing protein n=1 Tax=marine sediment metagenome TaxID=412755 RepID=X0W4K7_9ZZZZ